MKIIFFWIGLSIVHSVLYSQQQPLEPLNSDALNASNNFIYEANKALAQQNFVDAEADYRKAIAKNDKNTVAKYNMGNAYYEKNSLDEAFMRYKEASEVAGTKSEKHKTYHNIGNLYMKRKAYKEAIDAYEEALRNTPTDEETRYNLALAKTLLKKEQDSQKNKDEENKDNNKDKDNKDDKGDNNDKGNEEKQNKDEGEQKDGDEPSKQEENKEGKGDDKENKGSTPEDAPKDKQEKDQSRTPQLSSQQMKNILEAISNEEKKVQEKITAQRVKGKPVKTEKDW